MEFSSEEVARQFFLLLLKSTRVRNKEQRAQVMLIYYYLVSFHSFLQPHQLRNHQQRELLEISEQVLLKTWAGGKTAEKAIISRINNSKRIRHHADAIK